MALGGSGLRRLRTFSRELRTTRVLVSILIGFTLVAASANGQDRSTHVSIGTLQMTGGGVAQPPSPGNHAITGAAQQRAPTQTHITVGTLQMTGRAQARTQP